MDDMDIIALLAVAFIVVFYAWDFLAFADQLGRTKVCPPHDWAPNADNKLQCRNPSCKYVAGSDHVPRGDEQ